MQLSTKYSSKMQILTILYDSGESGAVDTALGIMNGMGFTLPVLRRNASIKAAFDNPYLTPPALPTTFFIDQNGKLVDVVKGSHNYDQWCSVIDSML